MGEQTGESRQRPPALPDGCSYCHAPFPPKSWMAVRHRDGCQRPVNGPTVTVITENLSCFDAACDWSATFERTIDGQTRLDAIADYRAHLATTHSGGTADPSSC